MKRLIANVVVIAAGIVLFAVPFQFCMDGIGIGFPFAWYHPGHGESLAIRLHSSEKLSDVVDLGRAAVSLAIFGVALLGRRFVASVPPN